MANIYLLHRVMEIVTFTRVVMATLRCVSARGLIFKSNCVYIQILPGGGVKCISAQYLGEKASELLVLYEDSTLRIFSIKNATCTSTISVQRQIGESICMDISPDQSRILIGSAGGQLCVVSIDSQVSFFCVKYSSWSN